MSRVKIQCERKRWSKDIEVAVLVVDQDGRHSVAAPLVFSRLEEGQAIADPTFKLRNHEAQDLMDELWNCGLRPSEGTGSAGSLAATERHLKDMQTIALGLLKAQGVTS